MVKCHFTKNTTKPPCGPSVIDLLLNHYILLISTDCIVYMYLTGTIVPYVFGRFLPARHSPQTLFPDKIFKLKRFLSLKSKKVSGAKMSGRKKSPQTLLNLIFKIKFLTFIYLYIYLIIAINKYIFICI